MSAADSVREAFAKDKAAEFQINGHEFHLTPCRAHSEQWASVDLHVDYANLYADNLRELAAALITAAIEIEGAQEDAQEESQDDVARRIHLSETGAS